MRSKQPSKRKRAKTKTPWRKDHGGLKPLSNKSVPDEEMFEAPSRLTQKELEELL